MHCVEASKGWMQMQECISFPSVSYNDKPSPSGDWKNQVAKQGVFFFTEESMRHKDELHCSDSSGKWQDWRAGQEAGAHTWVKKILVSDIREHPLEKWHAKFIYIHVTIS